MTKNRDMKKLIREFGLVFVVLFIVILMSFLSPVFMTKNNIMNIIRQISMNGIIAVGMTFVILTGGIDLSVGSVVAITSVVAGSLLEGGMHWLAAAVIGVGASLILGILNGYLVAYVGFQPFIATLATLTIGSGFAKVYADGKPFAIKDEGFKAIGQGYLLGIPIPIVLLVLVCTIGIIILTTTTFGRYIFAIGGNKNAAKLSGVRTKRVQMSVYVISSICAAITGLILSARISSGQPTAGEGYELDAIAATAIGGTSMNGGVGSLRGTILGFLLIGLLSNSMNLMNINSFWQEIVKGAIIIVAVFLDMKSKGGKKN